MPLYEYQCQSCAQRFELIQRFSDPPAADCPTCGGAVRKLLSSPAIQFKGSGWYVTDYSNKGKASEAADGGKPKAGETSKSSPASNSSSSGSTTSTSESSASKSS